MDLNIIQGGHDKIKKKLKKSLEPLARERL